VPASSVSLSGWESGRPGAAADSGAPLRVVGDQVRWLAAPGQPASLALADLRCDDADLSTPVHW